MVDEQVDSAPPSMLFLDDFAPPVIVELNVSLFFITYRTNYNGMTMNNFSSCATHASKLS